jgi:membrane-associated protease RseP (regulator of RpoE activity)
MRLWPFRRRRAPLPPLPADDLLITEERLRTAAEGVLIVHERQIRGPVILFRGALRVDPARAVDTLLARFGPFGYTPFLKAERDGGVVVQAWPLGEMTQEARPRLALALFALTVISTFAAGWAFFTGSETFDAVRAWPFPGSLLSGTPFALTLLAILGVHEFGHYFTARYYGAAVSLPYFIPFPSLFGTLGAIIRMRSPARDRNSLFDIAAAGPLAGLLVAIPALILGLSWSHFVPTSTDVAFGGFGGFGYSLFTRLFVYLRFGAPDGMTLITHPMADAAWAGCFVTALNLLPVGQLDGGRITYALSTQRHRAFGKATWAALLLLATLNWVAGSPNSAQVWFSWAVLVMFLVGFDHSPPLDDLTPLTPGRRRLGVLCLVLLVLLLPPIPI